MITSRPPTAVTTAFDLTPALARADTHGLGDDAGSMTSPSTIASARSGVTVTRTSSGSRFE